MKHFVAKGFTLTELLIAIAILGVLAAALLATLNPVAQIQKSNDARRKSDLAQIQRALEIYYQDNQAYPASTANTYQISGVAWGSPWLPFISLLPADPNGGKTYVYYAPANGQGYYLYASLDRDGQDPQVCHPGTGAVCDSIITNGIPPTACGGTCNYGASSTNTSP